MNIRIRADIYRYTERRPHTVDRILEAGDVEAAASDILDEMDAAGLLCNGWLEADMMAEARNAAASLIHHRDVEIQDEIVGQQLRREGLSDYMVGDPALDALCEIDEILYELRKELDRSRDFAVSLA
jgi:hypothetical protein